MTAIKKSVIRGVVALVCVVMPLWADTIILHDGSSYSGHFASATNQQLTFKSAQRVQYTFPQKDVQSIVFAQSTDVVTLRTGHTYSGQYTGGKTIGFEDSQGVQYEFPLNLISSVVFSADQAIGISTTSAHPANSQPGAKVISPGTEFSIRIDEDIDSTTSEPRRVYGATVNQDVHDAAGAIAIPQGSPAKIAVRRANQSHGPELALHLISVTVNNETYHVATAGIDEKAHSGFGANRETAEFGGGGAGLGALLGGIFGGGRGAAIGTLSGGAGGLMTEFLTRGRVVKVPAETVLLFKLNRQLVLESTGSSDQLSPKEKKQQSREEKQTNSRSSGR